MNEISKVTQKIIISNISHEVGTELCQVEGSHLNFHHREVLNYTTGISVEIITQIKFYPLYEPGYVKPYVGNLTEENVYPLVYECSNFLLSTFYFYMVTNVSS
jgi:hypothetical protein